MAEEQGRAQGPADPKQSRLSLDLDPETALGRYANFSVVAHTQGEFVLDFAGVLPGVPKPRVVTRVVMNPRTAKGLANALLENIKRYEEQFGDIEVGQAGGPAIRPN